MIYLKLIFQDKSYHSYNEDDETYYYLNNNILHAGFFNEYDFSLSYTLEWKNFLNLCFFYKPNVTSYTWSDQTEQVIHENLLLFSKNTYGGVNFTYQDLIDFWSINSTLYINSYFDSPWLKKEEILFSKIDANDMVFVDEFFVMLFFLNQKKNLLKKKMFKDLSYANVKQICYYLLAFRFFLEFGGGISFWEKENFYKLGTVLKNLEYRDIYFYKNCGVNITYFKNEICFKQTIFPKIKKVKDFLFFSKIWINRENYNLINQLPAIFLQKKINKNIFTCLSWLESCKVKIDFTWFDLASKISGISDTLFIDINKNLTRNLIIEQLFFLKGLVCFKYVLDNRTRIYVKNWPINYQLSKEVRNSMVSIEQTCLIKLKKDYCYILEKYSLQNTSKLAYFQNLSDLNKKNLINFLFSFFKKKNEYKTILNSKLSLYHLILNFSTEDIFELEMWCELILKFSSNPNWNCRFNEGLDSLIEFFQVKLDSAETIKIWMSKLNLDTDELAQLFSLHYEIYSLLKINDYTFKKIIFNDASSNVFQLLLLKTNCKNIQFLKMANILDNDTQHINVYKYIQEEFAKLKFPVELNYKLVKALSMRFCYGLTIYGIINCIDLLIIDDNWKKLSKSEQWAFAKKIHKNFWEILAINNIDIQKYLKNCKLIVKKNKEKTVWLSEYGLPIFVLKNKNINRFILRNKRKIFSVKLKNELLLEFNKESFSEEKKKIELFVLDKLSSLSQKKEKINTTRLYSSFLLKKLLLTINNEFITHLKKKINLIDKKLLLDEKCWKRRSIKPAPCNKVFKIRLKSFDGAPDLKALSRSISPDSNHSTDASILLYIIEIAEQKKVQIYSIHDSIGSEIYYSLFFRILFKKINIIFINNHYKNSFFNKNYKKYQENDLDIQKRILESKSFFS